MDLLLRPITPEELPAYVLADAYGFGERLAPREGDRPWIGGELERTLAAFEGDEIVGTGRNYTLELTVPGGALIPAGGVSWISVRPTHRRRGILTSIMTELVERSAVRGEPVSILTASEGEIYGRFGFGVATQVLGIRLLRSAVRFRSAPPPSHLRLVEPDESAKLAPELFQRVRRARPGAVARTELWWPGEWVPPEVTKQRFDVACEIDGRVEGLAVYGMSGEWSEGVPGKRLEVHDLLAATPDAEAALWHYLCAVDLTTEIRWRAAPLDLELPWLLTDARQVRATSLRDWLWLRPLDVPALLAARTYAVRGSLVVEVRDALRPDGDAAGRFLVEGGPDGATCVRTGAPVDLAMDVAELGAICLGGLRPTVLARANRIEERTAGALARADRMLSAERAPCAFTWF